jgi:hypothetical protein
LEACFIVTDSAGQKLAYIYFEEEPGRRAAAKLLVVLGLSIICFMKAMAASGVG